MQPNYSPDSRSKACPFRGCRVTNCLPGAPVSDPAFLVRARAKAPCRGLALRWQCHAPSAIPIFGTYRARYRDTCRPAKRQIRGATGQFRKGNRVGTAVAMRGLHDGRHGRASGSFVGSLRSPTGRKLFTSFSLRARSQSRSPSLTMTIWRVGFSSASWSSRVSLPA